MMEELFAKTNPVQTIKEHTDNVLVLLKQLRTYKIDIMSDEEWDALEVAAEFHDWGKIDTKFQNILRKKIGLSPLRDAAINVSEYNHNYLSPVFIDANKLKTTFSDNVIEVIYKAIYFHHNRKKQTVEDWWNMNNYIETYLYNIYQQYNWNVAYKADRLQCDYQNIIKFNIEKSNYNEVLNIYIKIKGILNRIDYCASAGVDMVEVPTAGENIGKKAASSIEIKGYNLNQLQEYMRLHMNENLIVKASTGGGKTEGSLMWIGNDKGFYTLPLKVSINSTFNRIKDEIKFKQVGLLHSDSLSVLIERKEDESPLAQHTNAKMLSYPLTISTIDQLFKFVCKYNGGEMSLATLSYSKLIIDEIQAYSPELIAVILVGLKQIVDMGGKFAIVTATFPHILYKLMDELNILKEVSTSKTFHSKITKRHRIKLLDSNEFDYKQIIEISKTKKVLVLCNTVGHAQHTYEKLLEFDCTPRLLHGSYIKKDRAILENKILDFAPNEPNNPNGKKGIWISTQIVEASLNIDFDVLFTEMCSIDSLIQRFGRIYRARTYSLEVPNIYILNNKSGYGTVIDTEIYDYSLEAIRAFDGKLLEESDAIDMKEHMMNMVFDENINPAILKSKYYRSIRDRIFKLLKLEMYSLSKEQTMKTFRNIDSVTLMPYQIYDELKANGTIKKWEIILGEKSRSLDEKQKVKDEIFSYTVNISSYNNLNINWNKEILISGIFLYNGLYDFDGEKGLGLIREYIKKK
jgi:CRISPR-associated endonuclease/helicase Cas3